MVKGRKKRVMYFALIGVFPALSSCCSGPLKGIYPHSTCPMTPLIGYEVLKRDFPFLLDAKECSSARAQSVGKSC